MTWIWIQFFKCGFRIRIRYNNKWILSTARNQMIISHQAIYRKLSNNINLKHKKVSKKSCNFTKGLLRFRILKDKSNFKFLKIERYFKARNNFTADH